MLVHDKQTSFVIPLEIFDWNITDLSESPVCQSIFFRFSFVHIYHAIGNTFFLSLHSFVAHTHTCARVFMWVNMFSLRTSNLVFDFSKQSMSRVYPSHFCSFLILNSFSLLFFPCDDTNIKHIVTETWYNHKCIGDYLFILVSPARPLDISSYSSVFLFGLT